MFFDVSFLQDKWSIWVDRFVTPIDDPGSRLFHVNLLMSVAFIFLWIYLSSQQSSLKSLWKSFLKAVLRKKYWWNKSTQLDYKIYFLNSLLKIFLFIPFLDFSYRFTKWTLQILRSITGQDSFSWNSSTFSVLCFTVGVFIFDDFLRFFHHWLMHKIPWLWKLHITHHSARVLTPISLYRSHPLESAMATVRNSLSTGVALGTFMFLFEGRFGLFSVLGVNFFGFTFNFLASNLRHSHIELSFGPLESIFISPKQHQIHHSTRVEHFDKNFGVSLSIWDRFNHSLILSRDVHGKLRFGLKGHHQQSLTKILLASK